MSSNTGSSGTTIPTGSNANPTGGNGNSNNNTMETSSGSSPPNNTPNNNNQSNNSQGITNIRRNNVRSATSILQDADRDFEGKTPKIGGVLALKSERVNKK
eukprot:7967351-Ditylum_brightwellii.AAC.1